MGARGPDLLAVDHPIASVADGTCAYPRDVRAGGGLGEQLTPDFLATHRGTDEELLGLLVTKRHHGRHAHTEADLEIAVVLHVLALLLSENDRLYRGAAATTPFLGPGDLGITCGGLLRLPNLGGRQVRGVAAFGGGRLRCVGFQPCTCLGAEGGFLKGVVKIHAVTSARFAQAASRRSSWLTRRSFQSLGAPATSASWRERR